MKALTLEALKNSTKVYTRELSWKEGEEIFTADINNVPDNCTLKVVEGEYGYQLRVSIGDSTGYYKITDQDKALTSTVFRVATFKCIKENAEKNYVLGAEYNWAVAL